MFQRQYKVKGEDVNDFMVMENAAFLRYTSRQVDTFLFVNGFTKLKMNTLKVGVQKKKDQITQYRHLMFTQNFTVKLHFKSIDLEDEKMNLEVHFYNQNDELCTTVEREIYWFDYNAWENIKPPKIICNYFTKTTTYRKVG